MNQIEAMKIALEALGFMVIWTLGLMVGIALIAALGMAVVLTTAFVADFLESLFEDRS